MPADVNTPKTIKLVYVYVYGSEREVVARSEPLGERVVIDYNHDGEVSGVEFIDAGDVEVSYDPPLKQRWFEKILRIYRQR